MTCIVALKDKDKVYIGADSRVTTGWSYHTLADPKVFKNGKFIIGVCGHLRTLQILRYVFTPPQQYEDDIDDMKYMVSKFADAMKKCLKEAGVSHIQDNVEHVHGAFLIGYKNEIYEVGPDYSVLRLTDPYLAEGSGMDYALGSLVATEGKPPKERVISALKAAAKYDLFVGPPFTVITS